MNSHVNVRAFFSSWGLFPSDEELPDDCNPDVLEMGINRFCYAKLIQEARQLFGHKFAFFCSRQINATDDAFYLRAETWEELEEAYLAHT